jgi:hypothetical protein
VATLLTLGATVAGSSAPEASLVLGVYVEPSGDELALDITPHAAAGEVVARSGDRQAVRFEAFAAIAPFGVDIAPIAWSWESEVQAGGQGSLSVPASSGNLIRGPLGHETGWGGPPPGEALIDLSVRYGGADSTLVIPLTRGAVSAGSGRTYDRSGHLLSVSLLDYGGRSDGERFDYVLPPNHGKTPSTIIAEMAALAGVPADRVALPAFGPQLAKSFESIGTGWLGRARDLAASFGYAVDFDASGSLTAYPWPPTGEPEAVFEMRSFAADPGLDVESDGTAPKCIIVRGTAPEIPGGGGVIAFPPVIVETIEPYSVPRGQFRQTSGPDAFTATGAGSGITAPYIVERVETYRTKHGTCILREEVVTWRWFAPKAARYTRDADDPPGETHYANNVWIYDPAAVAGDNAEAYAWSEYRFVVVSREITSYHYDGPNGELTRKVVAHGGWYNRSTATAQKEIPDDVPLDYNIEGNGRSVRGLAEEFYGGNDATAEFLTVPGSSGNLASEITRYEFSGGYKTAEAETSRAFLSLPGTIYLYSDGKTYAPGQEGSGESEEYRVSSIKRTRYLASGPSSSDVLTETRGPNGEFLRQAKAAAESYLPAIEVCDPALDAERSTRPFEAMVCAVFASGTGRTEEITNDYVENEAQAHDLAGWELRRRRALPVKMTVPEWAAAAPGTPIAIQMPRQGFPGLRGWIHRAAHSRSGNREAAVTELELRIET